MDRAQRLKTADSLLSAKEPCCRQKSPIVGKRALLQAKDPYCRQKSPIVGTRSLLQAKDPYYRQKSPIVGKRTLLQVKEPYCRLTSPATGKRARLQAKEPYHGRQPPLGRSWPLPRRELPRLAGTGLAAIREQAALGAPVYCRGGRALLRHTS